MEKLSKMELFLNNQNEQKENYSSRIILNFFRHDDKESDSGKTNEALRLTNKGRAHAILQAKTLKNPKLAKAFGSPKIRSQETAVLIMEGKNKNIDITAPADDLKDIAKPGLMGMPRIVADSRLDFYLDKEKGTGKLSLDAYKQGRYLEFIVKESDEAVKKNKDLNKNSTYSQSAAAIASIIKDYFNASGRWNKIVQSENTRKFPKGYQKDLERFFGSHKGVIECFLAKLIEKTEGIKKRDEFIDILDKNGFGLSEGFTVYIINQKNQPTVVVEYQKEYKTKNGEEKKFELRRRINPKIIDEIIKEGEELKKTQK